MKKQRIGLVGLSGVLGALIFGSFESVASGRGRMNLSVAYPVHHASIQNQIWLGQTGLLRGSVHPSQSSFRSDRHGSDSSSDSTGSGYHDFRPRSLQELVDLEGNWSFEWKVLSAETFQELFADVPDEAFHGRKLILHSLQLKDQKLMAALPRSLRFIKIVDPLWAISDLDHLRHLVELQELELDSGDVIVREQLQSWWNREPQP